MEISAENLVSVLLSPNSEHRDMVNQIKRNNNLKLDEYNKRIAKHKQNVEKAKSKLVAAQTDKKNPRILQDSIDRYKRDLEEAKKIVETCQRQIEILEAQLPTEVRESRVQSIQEEIKREEKIVTDLISAKGTFVQIKNLIEKAEELKRLDREVVKQ